MKSFIIKYKIYIIISAVAILILIASQFSKKDGDLNQVLPTPNSQQQVSNIVPSSTNFTTPTYSKPPENLAGKVDLNSEQVVTAIKNKDKIKNSLPIYIENFKTSNNMLTTLNVYTISSDPEYLIHIEIYGIDFNNQSTSKESNPNVTAFIDSFEEIKRQLNQSGVDIHNIYFMFGQRTFIQETADLWIKTYNLL